MVYIISILWGLGVLIAGSDNNYFPQVNIVGVVMCFIGTFLANKESKKW